MLALLLGLASCASDDACDAMCDAGLARWEACLPEWGLEWGTGYDDPADYAGWCDTYAWELRQLGEADRCATIEADLSAGDCATYASAFAPE